MTDLANGLNISFGGASAPVLSGKAKGNNVSTGKSKPTLGLIALVGLSTGKNVNASKGKPILGIIGIGKGTEVSTSRGHPILAIFALAKGTVVSAGKALPLGTRFGIAKGKNVESSLAMPQISRFNAAGSNVQKGSAKPVVHSIFEDFIMEIIKSGVELELFSIGENTSLSIDIE